WQINVIVSPAAALIRQSTIVFGLCRRKLRCACRVEIVLNRFERAALRLHPDKNKCQPGHDEKSREIGKSRPQRCDRCLRSNEVRGSHDEREPKRTYHLAEAAK